MSTTQTTPTHDTGQKRFKGSLAGTFARTLLIFTFIPLALMAGVAYFRTRALLRDQVVTQIQNLLSTQLKIVDGEIENKETRLKSRLESSDFRILTELALNTNPQSGEFIEIRNGIIEEFNSLNPTGDAPLFNQFLLLDSKGNVKIASNAAWEGVTLDSLFVEQVLAEPHSTALYGLSPIYENELILVTAQQYKTERGSVLGSVVGITEKRNLQGLISPLNGLSPLTTTYLVLSDKQFFYSDPASGELTPSKSNSQDIINSAFSELISQQISLPRILDVRTLEGEAALGLLQWSPKLHGGVLLQVKTSDIYSQSTSLIPFASLLALGTLLATGIALIIGINRIVRPLRALSDVTDDLANGDWSRRAEVAGRDEIGVLAGSINKVANEADKLRRPLEPRTKEDERLTRVTAGTAKQTTSPTDPSQRFNFEELARLYRASRLIAKANTGEEVFEIGSRILKDAPFPIGIFRVQNKTMEVFSTRNTAKENSTQVVTLLQITETDMVEIKKCVSQGEVFVTSSSTAPAALIGFMNILKLESAAFLPIRKGSDLEAILMIGGEKQNLSTATMQPYTNLADLMSITLEKAEAIQQTKKHLREVETLASILKDMPISSDLQSFYMSLLGKIHHVMGDYNLMVALYDEKSNTISIPFNYEEGKISSINPFPMGEGLTSILIRTREPLMIVTDTEKTMAQLGAKLSGKPGRSWMGAPLLVQNNPIGALIIQDLEKELAFNEEDLKFFTAVAGQVAGVIHNVRLLDESRHKALQLETAAEIARDISSSLNLDELLVKAVNFICERFDFYHASVFLHDLRGEYTVVREATGEIGTQLKRAGHKIAIGSKSIVGFVSSKGKLLVVDDIAKDETYHINPFFPNTRSEAAFPLKVGERILGEIDVHSDLPYAFTEEKLRSLQILSDQMAIAVVNTELFSETQEHLSQHRLLHHITSTAASGTTLEEALESAVNGLQVTLGGDRVTILLANREKNILEAKASTGYAEDITKVQVPIGSGITGWVAAHKRSLRIKNVDEDPRYIMVSPNTRSELAVPLTYRNELLGVLNVESEVLDAYTENDEEMLGTLGGSLAAIIANARLLEQIRAQAERDHLIYEVTSKIRRSTDIQSIMSTTVNELSRLTGARYAKVQIKPVNKMDEKDLQ